MNIPCRHILKVRCTVCRLIIQFLNILCCRHITKSVVRHGILDSCVCFVEPTPTCLGIKGLVVVVFALLGTLVINCTGRILLVLKTGAVNTFCDRIS
jgi:hypothetical protein